MKFRLQTASILFLAVTLLVAAPAFGASDAEKFREIYEREWAFRLQEFPMLASWAGDDSGAGRMGRVSEADQKRRYEVTWILRQDENGWAVSGMRTRLFDDMKPLTLNFEDPADMKRQVQAAEAEIARRLQP